MVEYWALKCNVAVRSLCQALEKYLLKNWTELGLFCDQMAEKKTKYYEFTRIPVELE